MRCKVCRTPFKKLSISHKVCSPDCALKFTEMEKAKKQRKADREAKVRLRSRREWLQLAQKAFNKGIRIRDDKDPCISCGRHHDGQYHAGHYLSVGARPELRFNEFNCNKQCAPCNDHLSGNVVLYRKNLIAKIGLEKVEWLEGPHPPKKYTVEELQEIIKKYKEWR